MWCSRATCRTGQACKTARDSGAAIFAYGSFMMAVLNFIIVAWVVFLLVKAVNRAQAAVIKKEAEEAAAREGPDAGGTAGADSRSSGGTRLISGH